MFGADAETVALFATTGAGGAADAGTSGASAKPNTAAAVNTVCFVTLPMGKPTFCVGAALATPVLGGETLQGSRTIVSIIYSYVNTFLQKC